MILRTLPGGLTAFLELFDWRTLLAKYSLRLLTLAGRGSDGCQVDFGTGPIRRLCVRLNAAGARLYDEQLRRRMELSVDVSEGYRTRAGVEWPRAGLRVVAVWED